MLGPVATLLGTMLVVMLGVYLQNRALERAVDMLRAEIGAVRAEVQAVRSELRAEIGTVRAEVQAVRSELRAEIDTVRAEFKQQFAEFELRITKLILDLTHRIERLEESRGLMRTP